MRRIRAHVAAMVIEPVPSDLRAFLVKDFTEAELAEGYSGALYALCATRPYMLAREADLAFSIDRARWERERIIQLRFDTIADAVRFFGWIG